MTAVGHAFMTGSAANIDDRALAALDHMGHAASDTVKRAVERGRHGGLPLLKGNFEQRAITAHIGVIDQNIDATKAIHCCRDHRCDLLRVGDVSAATESLAACGFDFFHRFLCRRFGAPVVHHHGGT